MAAVSCASFTICKLGTLVDRIGLDADYANTGTVHLRKAIPTEKGVRISGIDSRVQEKLKQGIPSPDEFPFVGRPV